MSNSVTKADLVATIAAETGLKKVEAEKAIVSFTKAVKSAMSEGKPVTLVGFGTFKVAERKARMGRNPQDKQPIEIPASNTVKFKPGKAMKDAVN